MEQHLTPKKIVERLDQYIVGQNQAKRAVAIALRNRYRRMQLAEDLRDEVMPKNLIMIGPTGVGKTEIARRLAKLVNAPFIKVEATKFTEVGYVGRDVESMIRDLMETAIRLVKEEKTESVQEQAVENANRRIVELLVPSKQQSSSFQNPFAMLFNSQQNQTTQEKQPTEDDEQTKQQRKVVEEKLRRGELESQVITVELEEAQSGGLDLFNGAGMEQFNQMQDALANMLPKKKKKRKLTVKEARKWLTNEEAQKLIDMDEVTQEASFRVEQTGIVFIDEIDKIASKGNSQSADVSREGVQRDILPIVEGSTIVTKYGPIKTDHILFIAAGAFHMAKPSDLIPELQGRFPIRVELTKLSVDDFVRILTEPNQALTKQYTALLATEGIELTFTEDAIVKLAEVAYEVNQTTDNIGARRLHTILEKLLEELSYEAADMQAGHVVITPEYVEKQLGTIVKDRDLSQFIL